MGWFEINVFPRSSSNLNYCFSICSQFLVCRVDPKHILDGTICPLELMRPHRFEGFQVTLLDANHCPGSVMFLFEGYLIEEFAGGPVLCTGDFRADKTFMNRLDGPLNFLSEFRLARIYLDNTYFKLDLEFPTRKSAQKKWAIN